MDGEGARGSARLILRPAGSGALTPNVEETIVSVAIAVGKCITGRYLLYGLLKEVAFNSYNVTLSQITVPETSPIRQPVRNTAWWVVSTYTQPLIILRRGI